VHREEELKKIRLERVNKLYVIELSKSRQIITIAFMGVQGKKMTGTSLLILKIK
jgi:hypothetical protein